MKKTITTKELAEMLIQQRNKLEQAKDRLIKDESDVSLSLIIKNNWYIQRDTINELLAIIKKYEYDLLY